MRSLIESWTMKKAKKEKQKKNLCFLNSGLEEVGGGQGIRTGVTMIITLVRVDQGPHCLTKLLT